MSLFPHDSAARRDLLIAAFVAAAVLLASAIAPLHPATGLLPGLWVVLRGDRRRHRCRVAPRA